MEIEMKLSVARKLFSLPTLSLRDGVLVNDEGEEMAFHAGIDERDPKEQPPRFKNIRAARAWLAARGYHAEVR